MARAPDIVLPVVGDGSGYLLRERDLAFLYIFQHQVENFVERSVPLGMSKLQYQAFREKILEALASDGLSAEQCDIRLKGSAASFFSGPHKLMPRTRQEVVSLFHEHRRRLPEVIETEEILRRLSEVWLTDNDWPERRPFDALYRLGISVTGSDYDLQLSSDAIMSRCRTILRERGADAPSLTLEHPKYGFVEKHLFAEAMPNVYRFGLRMSEILGDRDVAIAVFPSCGPSKLQDRLELSSHFRESDWRLALTPHSGTEVAT